MGMMELGMPLTSLTGLARGFLDRAASRIPITPQSDDMGNKVPGLPELPTGEITDLVESMFTTFSPLYVKEYGVALVRQQKALRDGMGVGVPYRLFDAPVASEPIIKGILSKRVSLGAARGRRLRGFASARQEAVGRVVAPEACHVLPGA